MSSLYIDGTCRISQEILKLRHSIQKAVHQHGFYFRYEQQSRSQQPLAFLRERLHNPHRYQRWHSHFLSCESFHLFHCNVTCFFQFAFVSARATTDNVTDRSKRSRTIFAPIIASPFTIST